MVLARRTAAALAACALLAAGCSGTSGDNPTATPGEQTQATPDTQSRSTPTPDPQTPHPKTPHPKRSNPTKPKPAAKMSPAQKAGQLLMIGADANDPAAASYAAITTHHVGNIMLTGRSTQGVAHTRELVRSLRDKTGPQATGRVPLFVATDQEGGMVQVLRGPGFADLPSGLEQGDLSPKTLRTKAKQWGKELRDAGVDVNLAPVMDTVPSASFASRNAPIGAFDREYGFTTKKVSRHGSAFVRGMTDAGVAAVVKHFPGLGRVTANTDVSSGVTDRVATRHDPYLAPFRAGIKAGSPFVMLSTAAYPKIDGDRPAAFSRTIVTSMLRGDLGFDGVVISDDLSNAKQVAHWSPAQRAVKFVAAGGDIVLAVDPTHAPAMHAALVRKYKHSDRFAVKVDAAVERVLAAKSRRPGTDG